MSNTLNRQQGNRLNAKQTELYVNLKKLYLDKWIRVTYGFDSYVTGAVKLVYPSYNFLESAHVYLELNPYKFCDCTIGATALPVSWAIGLETTQDYSKMIALLSDEETALFVLATL